MNDIEKKKYYMYDYFIQLNLATVNGKALKKMLARSRTVHEGHTKHEENERNQHITKQTMPIATVFFRFSHRDKNE